MVGAWTVVCPAPTPSRSTGSMVWWTSSPRSARSSVRPVSGRSSCSAFSRLIGGPWPSGCGSSSPPTTSPRSPATGRPLRGWRSDPGQPRDRTPARGVGGLSRVDVDADRRRPRCRRPERGPARVIAMRWTRSRPAGGRPGREGRGLPGRAGRVFGPRERATSAAGSSSTSLPRSPTRPSTNGCFAEETRAQAATQAVDPPRGDGSTDIHARVPDHVANRLRTYLDAYTSPRRTPPRRGRPAAGRPASW